MIAPALLQSDTSGYPRTIDFFRAPLLPLASLYLRGLLACMCIRRPFDSVKYQKIYIIKTDLIVDINACVRVCEIWLDFSTHRTTATAPCGGFHAKSEAAFESPQASVPQGTRPPCLSVPCQAMGSASTRLSRRMTCKARLKRGRRCGRTSRTRRHSSSSRRGSQMRTAIWTKRKRSSASNSFSTG